ncbi:DUF2130 domain-containing protein [Planctomycetota bacterium]
MPDQTIKCPKCGAEIPLTEALTNQIEGALRAQLEAESNKKTIELKSQKQALDKQAKELEAKGKSIAEQVAEQLEAERKNIAQQEKTKILAEQSEQTKALQKELEEKRNQLSEANKKELELLKKQRELEEKSEQIELEVQRMITDERKKIIEEASKKAAEEQLLKMREKDDQLASMKKQIDELKRKSEVSSQEAQGEALEGTLQDTLQQAFPFDKFEEVKKGARGADILQIVRNPAGKECGTILWESKNTKDFQKGWIEKLKADQQGAKADIAVIMSVALPKETDKFGKYEDVWITDYKSAPGLAVAFRDTLIGIARVKMIVEHQDDIKDLVYKYITSQEFTMRIKRIVDAYVIMQQDLEAEKRAMNKIWSKRATQISNILENLTGMHGEIEGIVGGQKVLPAIEILELGAVTKEERDADLTQ